MAVRGEDDVLRARDARAHHAEERLVLGGRGVADGVGNVDGRGAGLHGDVDHLDEEVEVGAGAVLGGELDVVGVAAGEADALGDLVEGLLARDPQLGLEVQVGGGKKDVDAVRLRGLDGAGGGLDVLALAAGKRGDAGPGHLSGDASARTSKSPSEAMAKPASRMSTPSRGKLVRHAQLLVVVHGAAGGLLAVAEGGVEEDDLVGDYA